MNKKGMVLIFGIVVILFLLVVFGAFFSKTINETNLAKRHISSIKAFWAAEAGLADAIKNLPSSPVTNTIDGESYRATSTYRATINMCKYYDLESTGTVTLPGGASLTRTVYATVKTGPTDPSKFQYGIQAANDLCFGGACKKPAEDYLDPDICNGHSCWKEFDTTLNFQDMFNYTQDEVRAAATHYTEDTFPDNLPRGVHWVDVTPGESLNMVGNGTGSGILIIDGDASFGAGTYQFDGIIFVLGSLDVRGTFDAIGSVIVSSAVGVDSINGTPTFHWDVPAITDALETLSFVVSQKTIVSWHE